VSSPAWPSLDENDNIVLKGQDFFESQKSNVTNLENNPDTTWKIAYLSSQVFSWKQDDKGAVDIFVVGLLDKAKLITAASVYDKPYYRLELALDQDTMLALKSIMENGPLKDSDNFDNVKYPFIGRSAIFKVVLKTLQKTEARTLKVEEPFPYLFDGREMARGKKVLLEDYPAERLSDNDMLAVQTNISSYDMPAREDSFRITGYSMSLREIYFLGECVGGTSDSFPKSLKRQGDSLMSPRKNKKAGQLAVFSDED